MRGPLLMAAGVLIPAAVLAQDAPRVVYEIIAAKTKLVAGEPVLLRDTVRNPGPSQVTLVTRYGDRDWRYRRVPGEWKGRKQHSDVSYSTSPPGELLQFGPGVIHSVSCERFPAGWSNAEAWGEFELQGAMVFPDWPWSQESRPADLFVGPVAAPVLRLQILEPTGVDHEAYDAFGGWPLRADNRAKLIERYPTSVYAGYAWRHVGGCGPDPAMCLRLREGHQRLMENPVYHDVEARSHSKLRAECESTVQGVPAFLAAHPDFVLRAELGLKLAACLSVLDRYPEAKEQCELIMKDSPGSEEAKKAESFISLLHDKGYLKTEERKSDAKPTS